MCCSPSTLLTEELDVDFYLSSHPSVTLLPPALSPPQLLSDCQPPLASCLGSGLEFWSKLSPYSFSSILTSPNRVTAAHGHSALLGLHHSDHISSCSSFLAGQSPVCSHTLLFSLLSHPR